MTAFPDIGLPLGFSRTLRVNVTQHLRSDLYCERTWINGHIQHIFDIPWNVLTGAQKILLENFFKSCRGKYLGNIAFVDPYDGVTYTCRLDNDDLVLSGWPVYSGAIRLVEVTGFKVLKPPVDVFPLSIPFQLPYSQGRRYETIIGAVPSDYEKRYEEMANAYGLQKWGVGGDALTDDQVEDLLSCWEGNGGPYRGFSFMDPLTEEYFSAHFLEPQITHTIVDLISDTAKVHSIRTTIEELIDDSSSGS